MAWVVRGAWSTAISELFCLPKRNPLSSLSTCLDDTRAGNGNEHRLPCYRLHTFEQVVAHCFSLRISDCAPTSLDAHRLKQTDPLPMS
jgi:hypothetical protein